MTTLIPGSRLNSTNTPCDRAESDNSKPESFYALWVKALWASHFTSAAATQPGIALNQPSDSESR